ncbi:MAG: hypothetical protein GVY36_09350 [Verrucomicrobia bacterium]|jgi:hypothetical protein|nr:hypothetical protein [Verrucomicrobiota bacterium]
MQRIKITESQKLKLNKILNKHSSFKAFSATRVDAYEYTSTLGVRVCPYCNIDFTYTVYETENNDGPGGSHKTPVCRPDIDHFQLKSKVGNLSLAQSNLIPACQRCNSRVKFRTEFNPTTHIHPFRDDFDSLKRFTVDLKDPDLNKKQSFRIGFTNQSASTSAQDIKRADKSIADLKLVARYQYHREEVVDLVKRARFYHKRKIRELEDLAETANLRRHLFSDAIPQINTVPLSKLKKDILELLGI